MVSLVVEITAREGWEGLQRESYALHSVSIFCTAMNLTKSLLLLAI